MTDLMKTLCGIPAVSGREGALRDTILHEISDYADCCTDPAGNLICFKKGKNGAKKKVLIDAHMDEVGLIASAFTEDGFVKFHTVGGIDAAVMLCRGVRFENGVKGVIGCKPVHLCSKEEKKKLPDEENLYIDIGAKSKEEAEKRLSLGDTAVFESEFTQLSDRRIKARAIDDRAGCAVLIKLLKEPSDYDFTAVFSVQEEVGCRGARTAAYAVDPDAAIVLEATTAADLHGVDSDQTVCVLGNGPAVSFMDRSTLYDRRLYDAALSSGVKCQPKAAVAGGNNAGAIHLTRSGIPTVAISAPCRYIHSPSCVADIGDIEGMVDLARNMLCAIASGAIL